MAQRRKRTPAVDVKVAYEKGGKVFARIKIGSPWLAAGIAGVSAVAILYHDNPEGVRTAVTNTLADFGEVLGVRRGSVLVDVCFHSKVKFLAFMDAVAAGTVKQKLQERFSKLGLKVKLELTVTVYESRSQMGIETPKEEKTTEEVSGSSRTPASLTVHFTLKDGTPSASELQVLAASISAKWMMLGILLNIPQDVLDEIYTTGKNKPYRMLLRWKYATTSATAYEDLYNALCHERVRLKDVAKRFCFHFSLKDGTPSDSELQVLAASISAKWMILGILLNIPQDVLDEIYAIEENKPYGMLLRWKYATTSATPYEDLYNALCHERVGLKNLAKRFCSVEGSSTFPEPEDSGRSSSKRPKLKASEESWSFAAAEASGRSSSKSPILEALARSLPFAGQAVVSAAIASKKKSFKK